jgi:hypothetical protein
MKQAWQAICLLTCAISAFAQPRTTTLALTVAPACDVQVLSSGALPATGEPALPRGFVDFRYRLRTSRSSGDGALEMEIVPAGASGRLRFTATLDGPGAALTGETPLSAGNLAGASFSADARTPRGGARGRIEWTLLDGAPAGVTLRPRIRCR